MHAGRLPYLLRLVEIGECGTASLTGALRQTGSLGAMASVQLTQCLKVTSCIRLPETNSSSRTDATPDVSVSTVVACRVSLGYMMQPSAVMGPSPALSAIVEHWCLCTQNVQGIVNKMSTL